MVGAVIGLTVRVHKLPTLALSEYCRPYNSRQTGHTP